MFSSFPKLKGEKKVFPCSSKQLKSWVVQSKIFITTAPLHQLTKHTNTRTAARALIRIDIKSNEKNNSNNDKSQLYNALLFLSIIHRESANGLWVYCTHCTYVHIRIHLYQRGANSSRPFVVHHLPSPSPLPSSSSTWCHSSSLCVRSPSPFLYSSFFRLSRSIPCFYHHVQFTAFTYLHRYGSGLQQIHAATTFIINIFHINRTENNSKSSSSRSLYQQWSNKRSYQPSNHTCSICTTCIMHLYAFMCIFIYNARRCKKFFWTLFFAQDLFANEGEYIYTYKHSYCICPYLYL